MRRGEWGNEKARAGNSGRWRGSGVEGWEVGDPPRSGDGGGGIWGDGGWRVGVRGGGYKRWGRGEVDERGNGQFLEWGEK